MSCTATADATAAAACRIFYDNVYASPFFTSNESDSNFLRISSNHCVWCADDQSMQILEPISSRDNGSVASRNSSTIFPRKILFGTNVLPMHLPGSFFTLLPFCKCTLYAALHKPFFVRGQLSHFGFVLVHTSDPKSMRAACQSADVRPSYDSASCNSASATVRRYASFFRHDPSRRSGPTKHL